MLEPAIVFELSDAFVPSTVQEKRRLVSAVQRSPGYRLQLVAAPATWPFLAASFWPATIPEWPARRALPIRWWTCAARNSARLMAAWSLASRHPPVVVRPGTRGLVESSPPHRTFRAFPPAPAGRARYRMFQAVNPRRAPSRHPESARGEKSPNTPADGRAPLQSRRA
jgi:hypothetical protein